MTAVMFVVGGCGDPCGDLTITDYELNSVESSIGFQNPADIAVGAEAGTPPARVASDVRLNVSVGIRSVTTRTVAQRVAPILPFVGVAYACSPRPSAQLNQIVKIELTCDRTIRGFKAGENILTSNARVYSNEEDNDAYYNYDDYLQHAPQNTLMEWISSINASGGYYGEDYLGRDVKIAFIPVGTTVEPGDYKFTFALETENGSRFVKEFASVTL